MAILNSKKAAAPADGAKAETVKKAPAKKAAKPAEAPKAAASAPTANVAKLAATAHLLSSPRVSEKAATLASRGSYVFNVPISANKIEVRKAVEARYGVSVADVRTIRGEGKKTRRGRIEGRRNAWKKAVVVLKPGQTIDLYEGV